MAPTEKFIADVTAGYSFKGNSLLLGTAVLDGTPVDRTHVRVPLRMFNRHGLIAGATGTGKTKTVQVIAEGLSAAGVPVLMMDMKGDLSGIACPGEVHPKITSRHEHIGEPWVATGFPVEFLTISGENGVRLRATVSEFGPVLFSKILDLNDTQAGVVSMLFKYCDDQKLPLLDLKDFKKTLQHISNDARQELEKEYGKISTATTGTILRKVVELEQEGADVFFGERSFEVEDLMRLDENGRGMLNIIRLTDIQGKPRMFSTFMLCLLAEIYATLPEEGDPEQPKLVIVIDEAHLIFKEASKALMEQLETIIKLIRSKGVGIFFCTQIPADVPPSILSQLGLKVQHALRAFTAKDRKAIKLVAENYPLTEYYDTDEVLTSLGIGEALVTALNEKGIPTPLVHTLLCAPRSRMDVLTEKEMGEVLARSALTEKYNEVVDRESAYEILSAKLKTTEEPDGGRSAKTSAAGVFTNPIAREVGRTVARELTRGLLGVLGLGGSRSRRKRSLF